MSDTIEHRDRWSGDIAGYALHALDERRAALVEQHLDECDACSEQLRWLAPAVDVIPASVSQLEPPPELRERLMAVVREEAASASPADVPARPASSRRSRLPSFGGFAWRPVLAVGAAALLIVAGLAGYELRTRTSSSGPAARSYPAAPQVADSQAFGTLEVNGDEGSLRVANLPATKPGEVYQAWVQEPAGSEGKSRIHPSTVFVVSDDGSGNVSIPAGLERAARVMVTREPKGGSEVPSESPVLTADIG